MRDFVDEELELARSRPLTPHYRVEPECDDPMLERLLLGRSRLEHATCWAKQSAAGPRWCAGLAVLGFEPAGMDTIGSLTWDYLDTFLPAPFESVADFNDDPRTTHADVLALFDRAIASRTAEVGK